MKHPDSAQNPLLITDVGAALLWPILLTIPVDRKFGEEHNTSPYLGSFHVLSAAFRHK